jgi:hypothetical protein
LPVQSASDRTDRDGSGQAAGRDYMTKTDRELAESVSKNTVFQIVEF